MDGLFPLNREFKLFPGIGKGNEKKLKKHQIYTWNDVLNAKNQPNLPQTIWDELKRNIQKIHTAISQANIYTIQNLIPSSYHWNLIPWVINNCKIAYLDIETTGLSPQTSHITTIAVFDGQQVFDFIRHDNLEEFPAFIEQFPVIVTYYGKNFDLPFIRKEMGVKFSQLHYDLCFLMRKVGLRGGLKSIEHQVGISRKESEGITGFHAVQLWEKYREIGDSRYLETLLAYNNEDVINLEYLLILAYNKMVQKNFAQARLLQYPNKKIFNPYQSYAEILKEIHH